MKPIGWIALGVLIYAAAMFLLGLFGVMSGSGGGMW